MPNSSGGPSHLKNLVISHYESGLDLVSLDIISKVPSSPLAGGSSLNTPEKRNRKNVSTGEVYTPLADKGEEAEGHVYIKLVEDNSEIEIIHCGKSVEGIIVRKGNDNNSNKSLVPNQAQSTDDTRDSDSDRSPESPQRAEGATIQITSKK